ncbi:MAG TPA: hypothetical protein IAA04_02715 [Candidatus Lachnoclostridium pullistercoris]|uniref:Uncharacterized protein n=1 Tax=Candidatus Lachnoclostridium pullistercoris TaxID=2838632 RepID=A0A9D2T576_9FIRM|nr:hypothetical protein [Candidatus Lachnoclostridium pullistercoris]
MMNNKFDDLTEQQKENMVEFAAVSAHCSEDVLNAIDGQVPMTYELFCRCMDELGEISAISSITKVMESYPDLTERYNKEEGWGPEKAEEDFQEILRRVKKAEGK